MVDFRPSRPTHVMERWISQVFRRFYNRSWPDAVTGRQQHFGILGLAPYPKPVWEARGRRTVDFLGINYYTKVYVCWGPQKDEAAFVRSRILPVGVMMSKRGDELNDMGWPIHPAGLGRMIRFLRRYRLPIYITENGIADAADSRRPRYLTAHLAEIAKAIEDGADIRGYFHWSLLDNFEWIKGFGPRFGLYAVDYDTMGRTPRESAKLYGKVIAACRATAGPEGKPTVAAIQSIAPLRTEPPAAASLPPEGD
jgi:beta-glucosidase